MSSEFDHIHLEVHSLTNHEVFLETSLVIVAACFFVSTPSPLGASTPI